MLIKQIALKNFRQYKDLQVVEFSCDKEKNVTVILGDNTSGKTTLIQAFNWCLYGTTSFKTRELINSETLQEMSMFSSVEVSVEVELQHEDKLYVIRRTQVVTKNEGNKPSCTRAALKVEYKEESGEMQEVPTFAFPTARSSRPCRPAAPPAAASPLRTWTFRSSTIP